MTSSPESPDLFDEQGAFLFQVYGHTSYVAHWLRNPHFVAVRGEGRCIGGIDVDAPEHAAMRGQAMSHMLCFCRASATGVERRVLVQAMSAF